MSDETKGTVGFYVTSQPSPAPVIDVADVRRLLAESMFLNDHTGIEVVFSMLRAVLTENDRLAARVAALESRGLNASSVE